MNRGEMRNAKRRALNLLDEWLDTTGIISKGSSYYWELQSVVEDAVECGAQAALGIHKPVSSGVEDD